MVSKGATLNSIIRAIDENESHLLGASNCSHEEKYMIRVEAENLRAEVRSIFVTFPFFVAKHRNTSLKIFSSESDEGDFSDFKICLNNKADPKEVLGYMMNKKSRDRIYSSISFVRSHKSNKNIIKSYKNYGCGFDM